MCPPAHLVPSWPPLRPLSLKVLNLPPSLASSTPLLILAGVIHGPKKPKSIQAYQLMVADEVQLSYKFTSTAELGDGVRLKFRAKLALHSCDGPANCLCSNQQGAGAKFGCVRCKLEGRTSLGRVLYGCVRRCLPPDHPYRTDPSLGEEESRPPPPQRTLQQTIGQGLVAEYKTALKVPIKDWSEETEVLYLDYSCTIP